MSKDPNLMMHLKKFLPSSLLDGVQSKSIIGIDIGTCSVKLAQMVKREGKWILSKSTRVPIESKQENDEQDVSAVALQKALADIETKGAKVICVVNCPKTSIRKIVTPSMPKQELVEAVKWEVKNYISFPLDEAICDFDIWGEVVDKGVKKLNLAVAVSPRETIDQQLSVYSQCPIKVSAMIPLSLATQNLIAKSELKQGETIGVVEIGSSITELNIYSVKEESLRPGESGTRSGKDVHLEFSRKLPLAGEDMTRSLTGALVSDLGRVELSMEEAETIKRRYGIPRQGETEWKEDKISLSQVLSLIRPLVEQLANEIERSFDFYREESHGGKVDRIILFGGGAQLKGLREFLADELGMDVTIGNSFRGIQVLAQAVPEGGQDDQNNDAHRMNLAIGAALEETERINLLPVELREETKRFVERVSLRAVATFIMVSLLIFYAGMRVQVGAYQKKVETAKLEKRSLAPQMQKIEKRMLIEQVLKNHPFWEEVFKEISNVMPSNMHLTHLSMKENVLHLKGIIIQGGQTDEVTLPNFMLTLEQGLFKNVSLVTTKKIPGNLATSRFAIKCEVE